MRHGELPEEPQLQAFAMSDETVSANMWCSACAQYLLQQFIEVQAMPKGAPVYQPPGGEATRRVPACQERGRFAYCCNACCCLSAEYGCLKACKTCRRPPLTATEPPASFCLLA